MNERPLIFAAESVRGILAGIKTQTRIIVKPQPAALCRYEMNGAGTHALHFGPPMRPGETMSFVPPTPTSRDHRLPCPYGVVGDRLWVITIRPICFGNGRFGVGDDGFLYRIDRDEPLRMRTQKNHNGYEEVSLRFNGNVRAVRINRLVCEAFYGPPENGQVARHLDGNRANNRPDNLDWGTVAQNQADAAALGSFSGELGSQAALTAVQVDAIRSSDEKQAVIANRFGVTQPTISKIKSGARWSSSLRAVVINQPRWASRLTLEIVEVRVHRLQEISEDDARAEGVRHWPDIPDPHPYGQGARWSFETPTTTDQCLGSARSAFANAWDAINGKRRVREYLSIGDPGYTVDRPWRTVVDESASWAANPWVWALTFRRLP